MRMAGGVEVRANAAEDVFLGSCPLYVELFEGDISILSYLDRDSYDAVV